MNEYLISIFVTNEKNKTQTDDDVMSTKGANASAGFSENLLLYKVLSCFLEDELVSNNWIDVYVTAYLYFWQIWILAQASVQLAS